MGTEIISSVYGSLNGVHKAFELRKYRKGILLRFPYYGKPDVLPEYVDDYMLYKAYGENTSGWIFLGYNIWQT